MPKITDFFAELGLKKDKFEAGMQDAGKAPSKLKSKWTAGITAIGLGIAGLATGMMAFGLKAMASYDEQAKAEAGLLTALKGRRDLQQYMIKQAGDLQRITLFGDEATIQAQRMLSIMGLSAIQIKDLIPLVQDFATGANMDLVQAASLTGKAIASSTNALSRYKVEMDSTATQAEKATIVMAKFTEMYGGQAKAAAEAGTAGIQQLKGAWGDLMEIIGAKVGPFMSAFAKLLKNKMLDEMAGGPATGMQQVINEYLDADTAGREQIIKQYKFSIEDYKRLAEKAKQEQNKAEREHWTMQIDITSEALEKVLALHEEGVNKTGELTEEEKAAQLESAKAVEEANKRKRASYDAYTESVRMAAEMAEAEQDRLRKALTENTPDSKAEAKTFIDQMLGDKAAFDNARKLFNDFTAGLSEDFNEELGEDDPEWLEKLGQNLQLAGEKVAIFKEDMGYMMEAFIEDFIGNFADGIGKLMTGAMGADQFFNSVLSMFGGFVGQMGKMFIAYGISMKAFKDAIKNPIALVVAGAALVAIGSAISSMAAKGVGGAGGGGGAGMAGTGSSMGTYYKPTDTSFELSTEISGDDLRIILGRSQRKSERRY